MAQRMLRFPSVNGRPIEKFVLMCLLALVATHVSCTLNPQPEPPRDLGQGPVGGSATGTGTSGSTGSTGAGVINTTSGSGGTFPPQGTGGSGPAGAGGAGGSPMDSSPADGGALRDASSEAAATNLEAGADGVVQPPVGSDGAGDGSVDETVVPEADRPEHGDAAPHEAATSHGPNE